MSVLVRLYERVAKGSDRKSTWIGKVARRNEN